MERERERERGTVYNITFYARMTGFQDKQHTIYYRWMRSVLRSDGATAIAWLKVKQNTENALCSCLLHILIQVF